MAGKPVEFCSADCANTACYANKFYADSKQHIIRDMSEGCMAYRPIKTAIDRLKCEECISDT